MILPEVAQHLLAEGVSQEAITLLGNEDYETEQDLKQAGFTFEILRTMGVKGKSISVLLRLYGQSQQHVPAPALPTTLTLEMPGTTKCGKCSNVLASGADFCSRCGTPVASSLVCVKCGAQGSVGETFCLKDGIPLVPQIDAICINELMIGENMSIVEATKALQEMDTVRRGKLQNKAMQRQQGGGLLGGSIFLG